jgi:hypothetical protein
MFSMYKPDTFGSSTQKVELPTEEMANPKNPQATSKTHTFSISENADLANFGHPRPLPLGVRERLAFAIRLFYRLVRAALRVIEVCEHSGTQTVWFCQR